MGVELISDFSFEKSPKREAYLAKFEAELSQRCEKLVGLLQCFVCLLWVICYFIVYGYFSFFIILVLV